MNERPEATESDERGKGYDGVILPLMLLGGAVGLAIWVGWFIFFGLYLLFILGLMVSIFTMAISGGF